MEEVINLIKGLDKKYDDTTKTLTDKLDGLSKTVQEFNAFKLEAHGRITEVESRVDAIDKKLEERFFRGRH